MSKPKIAAFVGKFYPPHIGHLTVIDKFANKFDKFYIIISKNNIRNQQIKDKCNFNILDAEVIKSWFVKHYKENSKIKVEIFDESNFKPYPNDTEKWVEKFKMKFPDINVKIADESYRNFNEKYFPECEFIALDRDYINIHSSHLREDMKKYYKFLIPEAKDYFKNKTK